MQFFKHNPTDFAAHHSFVRNQQTVTDRFIEAQRDAAAVAAAKRKTVAFYRANREFLRRRNPTLTTAQIAEQLLDHFLAA